MLFARNESCFKRRDSRTVGQATKTPQLPRAFEDFSKELFQRLAKIPPKSRLMVEFVTNADGQIHNHRFEEAEDKGPLTLRMN